MKPKKQRELNLDVKPIPPTLLQVQVEAKRIGLPDIEAERFHAYFESNGWMVGRNKMKSWTAALRHWFLMKIRRDMGDKYPGNERSRSVYELIKIMEANQRIADELKRKHCTFVAGGNQWSSLEVYRQWQEIKAHISDLNDEIANMKT